MSNKRWTSDDLKNKGLQEWKDGVYTKKIVEEKKEVKVKKGRPKLPEVNSTINYCENKEDSIEKDTPAWIEIDESGLFPPPSADGFNIIGTKTFIIKGIIPGLNGSRGLMRAHWSKIKKDKQKYFDLLKEQNKDNTSFSGPVKIEYVGYKSNFMDWDNFAGSFKNLGDCLVKLGVIKDDNPKVIQQFIPKQIKCKRHEQRVEIIITEM